MGRRPCGVGTSSLVALAGGWVNKTSLSLSLLSNKFGIRFGYQTVISE